MKDLNGVKVAVKASKSKEEMMELIEAGIIRQEWLSLFDGFNDLFKVVDINQREITSYKTGEKISVDILDFQNEDHTFSIWESTFWKMYVVEEELTLDGIQKDKPVYFRDDFLDAKPSCKTLKDFKAESGGLTIWDKYYIAGAVVTRSKVDESRWAVNFSLYRNGRDFLKLEQQITKDKSIKWISEERLHELASMTKVQRTLKDDEGNTVMVLPAKAELGILYNADTNIRFAQAQFIVQKIWE